MFYFFQSEVIMANFLRPVRRNAGLGDPPDPYFNNLPESANAVVKREVDSKPSEMSHFCTKMEALVNQQKRDCEAAVLNRGPAFRRIPNPGNFFTKVVSDEYQAARIRPAKVLEDPASISTRP